MESIGIVRRMFEAYLAGDAEVADGLLADSFTFTSPQDDHIDKTAFMQRCFPTADRVVEQNLLEIVPAGTQARRSDAPLRAP